MTEDDSGQKQQLKNKLVDFQKEIISLTQAMTAQKKQSQNEEDAMLLELIAIIDAFENVFSSLIEKQADFDKTTKRAIKSFQAIYRKLLRLLEDHHITSIKFPANKAEIGLCKVIETQQDPALEDGTIISIVKNGYQQGERILRPAEVTTVSNQLPDS